MLKCFTDIVKMLYQADIVEEDTILHWYKKGSHTKVRGRLRLEACKPARVLSVPRPPCTRCRPRLCLPACELSRSRRLAASGAVPGGARRVCRGRAAGLVGPPFACRGGVPCPCARAYARHNDCSCAGCLQGRAVFLKDIEPFMKWLEEAEEEDD